MARTQPKSAASRRGGATGTASTRAPHAARGSAGGRSGAQPKGLVAALVAVLAATFAVYARALGFGFIQNYDDSIYVTQNPHVTTGLQPANVVWAFTQQCAGNWHPVTMLSHMLDCQLFGVNAGPAHLENLVLHLVNTVLLFQVLRLATSRPWPSLFVAALFALHPMHVESVAWIAERKDVLSTLFWLLTMWAYVRWARERRPLDYALAVVAFGVGLMAKPMLVTLPFVLLLFDVWPLGRLRLPGFASVSKAAPTVSLRTAILEKLPLLALVAVSAVLTLHAQKQVGALSNTVQVSLALRVCNAFIATAAYRVRPPRRT